MWVSTWFTFIVNISVKQLHSLFVKGLWEVNKEQMPWSSFQEHEQFFARVILIITVTDNNSMLLSTFIYFDCSYLCLSERYGREIRKCPCQDFSSSSIFCRIILVMVVWQVWKCQGIWNLPESGDTKKWRDVNTTCAFCHRTREYFLLVQCCEATSFWRIMKTNVMQRRRAK